MVGCRHLQSFFWDKKMPAVDKTAGRQTNNKKLNQEKHFCPGVDAGA
jgi:hypothetical protein